MIEIRFSKHLLHRLKLRGLTKELVSKILANPQQQFQDTVNKTSIAVSKQSNRYYMVAYIKEENSMTAITIHPIKPSQINNRLKTGRWKKIPD